MQLPLQVLVPEHLDALSQVVVDTKLLTSQRRAAGFLLQFQLADAAISGAKFRPQEDHQVQVAREVHVDLCTPFPLSRQ